MTNLPVLRQLVELLHWILVSVHGWMSSIGLAENWAWGLAIIGLTIIVRLVLFPLTWKQFSSAQAMQAIQPKIKELQQRHKSDRAKLQQETMKLYQEHRVNPFASCLPVLLQLPVFIALYYAIKGTDYLDKAMSSALADASFLWIPHLGERDPYYILLIVYVLSQLISTELMLTAQTDKSQKMIMRAMPIMFVFFLFSFPSGLFVYWVTTNLWTIGQQLIIRKVMKPKDLATMAARPAKRSRFMEAVLASQDARPQSREELVAQRRAEKATKAGGAKAADSDAGGQPKGAARPSGAAGKKGGRKPPPGKGRPGSGGKGKTSSGPAGG